MTDAISGFDQSAFLAFLIAKWLDYTKKEGIVPSYRLLTESEGDLCDGLVLE